MDSLKTSASHPRETAIKQRQLPASFTTVCRNLLVDLKLAGSLESSKSRVKHSDAPHFRCDECGHF
ncbi:hypothetical protein S1OALGB6SA_1977 [Olavius algarvensis spirochete endosymbiont]|nr:hypothetical protein S1OALGB6SA_1977 [Olavius algarvensis spirochete endosymbiont]